jgi:tetratricopeptide (TPR) repeat protein
VLLLLLALAGYLAWRRTSDRAAETDRLYVEALISLTPQSAELDLRLAAEKLHQVVVRRPRNTVAVRAQINTLIALYERTRDPQWLQKAANSLSSAPAAVLTADEQILFQARIDLNQTAFQGVIRALQNAPALLSRSEPANRLLGRAYAASNQMDAALQSYAAAIHIQPESWLSHNDLGVALINLGRIKDAREEFVRVTELQPQSPVGYENLASALFDEGKFSKARKNFEIAIQLAPSAAAYYNLGLVSFFAREYGISITFFEKAIEMRPNSDIYFAALADSWRHLHRLDRARDGYARALSLLDQRSEKRTLTVEEQSRLAIYLARLGDRNAANAILNTFLPNFANQNLSYARAIVAMLEGRSKAANKYLKNAEFQGCPHNLIDLNPDFDDLHS